MKGTERTGSPVQKQVEAYREAKDTWLEEQEKVRACWLFEDLIKIGLGCGEIIRGLIESWRDRVFRGIEEENQKKNEVYRDAHEGWLGVTEAIIEGTAQSRLEVEYHVDGIDDLREMAERMRRELTEWKDPKVSLAVGLREINLTPEAASVLDSILKASTSNLAPMLSGSKMESLSPQDFLSQYKG